MHLNIEGYEMEYTMERDTWHDVDEKAFAWSACITVHGRGRLTYLVTLSSEWKTSEFLHMAIATALLPNARQNVLMKSRFD